MADACYYDRTGGSSFAGTRHPYYEQKVRQYRSTDGGVPSLVYDGLAHAYFQSNSNPSNAHTTLGKREPFDAGNNVGVFEDGDLLQFPDASDTATVAVGTHKLLQDFWCDFFLQQ